MACPASPPITMAQVLAEHGGTTSTKLSAYIRGGSFVPNIGANSGVPTSVPIKLSQLCGSQHSAGLSASASPSSLYKAKTTPGSAVSGASTVTVSGSTGTVTWLWTRVSGDAVIGCSNTTSNAPTWSATVNAINPSRVAVWKCKVTDSSGFVYTNNVTITLEYVP